MRNAVITILFIVLSLHAIAEGAGNQAEINSDIGKEIENLQAAEAAWRRNDSEFRWLRKQDQVSQNEIREFAEFVAGLKRQVIEGCEAVRNLGVDANQHGVDCAEVSDDSESKGGGASLVAIKMPVREEDEAALVEKELEKLASDFDGMILKAQDELKKSEETSISGGDRAGSGHGNNESTEGDPSNAEADAETTERVDAEPGAGIGDKKSGKIPTSAKGDAAESSDDDVVARQLREAAESEIDPVLKEQLWKEYRKYKESTR